VIAWTRTDDAAFPWEAHPKGQHWRIRLNDFPDDHMYTIVVNGAELGDFDDWPETWDRGAGQSALAENAITITCPVPGGDPETLVTRYQNGEHVEVWRELVALGDGIREGPYVEPANAIARETMRRARHNVELLFSRLRELDYEFYGEDSEPFRPCTPEEAEALTQAGRNGLILPLSLAAWIKEVGWVDFAGSHPALSFNEDDDGRPGIYTDPMEITCWNFLDISKAWKRRRVQKNKPVRIELGADAKSKARFAAGWQAEGTYSILLPNSAADALIDGAPTAVTFVEYLRLSFQWGGFPGWANYQKRPEKELDFLRKGLLSV
jgi:hypothetical protein